MNFCAVAAGIALAKKRRAELGHAPEEIVRGIFPNSNNTGFSFAELPPVSQAFVAYANRCQKPILDIGCAYGVATLPALANSTCDVYAADLSQRHLDVLRSQVPLRDLGRVACLAGDIRHNPGFAENSLSAIHLSKLCHFFSGPELQALFEKMLYWLEPGGKLFVATASIYSMASTTLLETYTGRRARGEPWPGEIADIRPYQGNPGRQHLGQGFLHLFTAGDFADSIGEVGFTIEDCHYYDLEELGEEREEMLAENADTTWDSERYSSWVGLVSRKPIRRF